jgi:hypothetical protein
MQRWKTTNPHFQRNKHHLKNGGNFGKNKVKTITFQFLADLTFWIDVGKQM